LLVRGRFCGNRLGGARGLFVSSYFSPRRSAHRRSAQDAENSTRISPWHVIGLGFVALLGTGVLAAIDRHYERASAASPEVANGGAKPAIADAPRVVEIAEIKPVAAPPTIAAPTVLAAPAPAPASAASSAPGRVAFAMPALMTPAVPPPPAPAKAAAETPAPPSEGPTVTASVSQALPPVRAAAPPAPVAAPKPAIASPPPGRGLVKTGATAPLDCVPDALRAVLADLGARFGEVTFVSTNQLNTSNHTAGGGRDRLHLNCKAVDFRIDKSRAEEIKAYLRTRPEIGGVASYQNGVVHMDVKAALAAAPARPTPQRTSTPGRAAPQQAAAPAVPADAMRAAPSAPQTTAATGLFAPVTRDRNP
jgi:hypothetical protein